MDTFYILQWSQIRKSGECVKRQIGDLIWWNVPMLNELAVFVASYSPLYVVEWGLPNIIASVWNKRGIVQSSAFAGIDQAKGKVDPGSEYTVG